MGVQFKKGEALILVSLVLLFSRGTNIFKRGANKGGKCPSLPLSSPLQQHFMKASLIEVLWALLRDTLLGAPE